MIAKANPIETYNHDNSSLDEIWQKKVNDNIRDATRRPRNAMNNVSISQGKIVKPFFGSDGDSGGKGFFNPAVAPNLENAFSVTGAEYNKLANITAYNFFYNIVFENADTIPSNALNYNVPIYFTWFAGSVNSNSNEQEFMMCYPVGTLNWDGSVYSWVGSPTLSKTFNLKNTIVFRDYIGVVDLDFRNTNQLNSNDKITQNQYDKLINDTSTLIAPSIIADNTTMTLAEIDHFELIMNNSGYLWHLSMSFNPIGILANYQT